MKINSFKILYSTTIPIQSYGVNDKFSAEIEYDTTNGYESPIGSLISEEMETLKKIVDEKVTKLYPNRYGNEPERGITINYGSLDAPIQRESTHEERRIGDIANDIRSCKDLTTLSSYRLIAKSKPEFQEAYDEMFQKLSK